MKLMKTTSNQSKLGLLLMVVTQNMKAKETKKDKEKNYQWDNISTWLDHI